MTARPIGGPTAHPVASSQPLPTPQLRALGTSDNDANSLPPSGGSPMTGTSVDTPSRVRLRHVEWVHQRLSLRDQQIIHTIHRLRLVSGAQLGRLHFTELSTPSRDRTRRRVLHRLVAWRVLATRERRVGGVRAGSVGLIYTLDTTGTWLIRLQAATTSSVAPRRPSQPSAAFTSHTLAVTELYVGLIERARRELFQLGEFQAEPACWWPDKLGGHLKPDAHILLATADYRDDWWIEVDQATETIPRIRRKLLSYLDFAHRGGTGPVGILPRLLITTPTPQRSAAIAAVITALPPPADQVFRTCPHVQAVDHLINTLLGSIGGNHATADHRRTPRPA